MGSLFVNYTHRFRVLGVTGAFIFDMNEARQRRMATPMLDGPTKYMDITAMHAAPQSQTLWV